jgi:Mg2+/citrate symporter
MLVFIASFFYVGWSADRLDSLARLVIEGSIYKVMIPFMVLGLITFIKFSTIVVKIEKEKVKINTTRGQDEMVN